MKNKDQAFIWLLVLEVGEAQERGLGIWKGNIWLHSNMAAVSHGWTDTPPRLSSSCCKTSSAILGASPVRSHQVPSFSQRSHFPMQLPHEFEDSVPPPEHLRGTSNHCVKLLHLQKCTNHSCALLTELYKLSTPMQQPDQKLTFTTGHQIPIPLVYKTLLSGGNHCLWLTCD